MIVGTISLAARFPLLLVPCYLLAVFAAFSALRTVRSPDLSLQKSYMWIIQSQIGANLGGMAVLAGGYVIPAGLVDNQRFYIELVADCLFHFASLCYVAVAVHRYLMVHNTMYERDWAAKVPRVILSIAATAIGKTLVVKLSTSNGDGNQGEEQGHMFVTFLFVGSPLAQILAILTLDILNFLRLRDFNSQISADIATNKNVEWRVLSQSIVSCIPNALFLALLWLLPDLNAHNYFIRSLATVGIQIFDVIIDSLVVVGFSKAFGGVFRDSRPSVSPSLSIDSHSNNDSSSGSEGEMSDAEAPL